ITTVYQQGRADQRAIDSALNSPQVQAEAACKEAVFDEMERQAQAWKKHPLQPDQVPDLIRLDPSILQTTAEKDAPALPPGDPVSKLPDELRRRVLKFLSRVRQAGLVRRRR